MPLRTISSLAAFLLLAACGNGTSGTVAPDVPPSCSRPVSASSLPGAQVLLREKHKAGDNVPFTVPAGTASITIVHQAQVANLGVVYKGHAIDNSAVPGVVLMPDGGRAYDDNDPAFAPASLPDGGGTDPSTLYSFYAGGSPSTAAFTLPNTAFGIDAGVPSGNWHFTVNDYAYECAQPGSGCTDGGTTGNTYDVMVLAKGAPPAKPTLDVAFYIVADVSNLTTGQKLTAASAATDPSAQRMVKTLTTIFGNAGITVGSATFYDVDAASVARFGTHINADTTGPCDELDQMFLLSSAHPSNTLNLFLVQSITSKSNNGGSVVGIDGTIPGPASLAGTVHSGAAVSLADLFRRPANCVGAPDLSCGADVVAFIAAHEAGHFLGLFHTSEREGRDFDPVSDTAKCPCLPCASSVDQPNCTTGGTASNPIIIDASRCAGVPAGCGGADNLMFWQLQAPYSVGTITPQQAAIMALSPVVH